MSKTPDARVKDSVKKELDSRGFWKAGAAKPVTVSGWYYMPVSNGMGTHGIPDFVCCWLGKFFSIETKAPGGKPTPNQLKRHEEIQEAGGEVLVIDDVSNLRKFFDGGHSRSS